MRRMLEVMKVRGFCWFGRDDCVLGVLGLV